MAVTIDGSTGVTYSDNIKHKYGTSGDLEIYHDGSNSYIKDTGTGNLVLGFGSASDNELDAYEEGTWTPAISGVSYGDTQGTYIKIGTLCFVTVSLNAANTSKSGDIFITGLPFAGKGGTGEYYNANSIIFTEVHNLSLGSGETDIYGRIPNGTSHIQLLTFDGANHTTMAGSSSTLGSNHTLRASFSYQTA